MRLAFLALLVGGLALAADRALVRVAAEARAEAFRQAALEVKCPTESAWLVDPAASPPVVGPLP